MKKLISKGSYQNLHHIVLEEQTEGTYIFIYLSDSSKVPERDYLADDMAVAKAICEEDHNISPLDWLPYKGKPLMNRNLR